MSLVNRSWIRFKLRMKKKQWTKLTVNFHVKLLEEVHTKIDFFATKRRRSRSRRRRSTTYILLCNFWYKYLIFCYPQSLLKIPTIKRRQGDETKRYVSKIMHVFYKHHRYTHHAKFKYYVLLYERTNIRTDVFTAFLYTNHDSKIFSWYSPNWANGFSYITVWDLTKKKLHIHE